ncbi:MAG: hypothetical protein H6728_14205 [Myxococcales bacterium]|nr:hypothetical protein [Myxococcales bacterium]MCB9644225.1 hypothetical protein [Myxococcales bacterium]
MRRYRNLLFLLVSGVSLLMYGALACTPPQQASETSAEQTPSEPAVEKQAEAVLSEKSVPEEQGAPDATVAEEPALPEPSPEAIAEAEPKEAEPEMTPEPTQEKNAPLVIQGGDVDGSWCGDVEIQQSAKVPKDKTLTLCAGTHVRVAADQNLLVEGTLLVQGAMGQVVRFEGIADARWTGLYVDGTIQAKYLEIDNATVGIQGGLDSVVEIERALVDRCSDSMRLANGGTLRYVRMLLGPLNVSGGKLVISDSVIDLDSPAKGRDCTGFRNADISIDHVLFTRCHCPLHFNSSTGQVSVTNSIFDQAAYPMMIAKSKGTFSHNHFIGGAANILDIGGSIDVNVAGNYWDGTAPNISSSDDTQFKGTKQFSNTAFSDVGPRP